MASDHPHQNTAQLPIKYKVHLIPFLEPPLVEWSLKRGRKSVMNALVGKALKPPKDCTIPNFCRREYKMLSKIPIDLQKMKKDTLDKEILRSAIIAELDAINLYEQMADLTRNADIRKVLLDIAREEKTHVGEFQTLLLIEDKEQFQELEEGKNEVQELLTRKKRY
jgi:hypothetical protein